MYLLRIYAAHVCIYSDSDDMQLFAMNIHVSVKGPYH